MSFAGKRRLGAALGAIVLGAALLLVAGVLRNAALADDDGYTTEIVRNEVYGAIARSHADGAPSWMDARQRLRAEVHQLAEEPFVVYTWLVRAKGSGLVSYASGGPGKQGDEVYALSGAVGEAAAETAAWLEGGAERYVPLTVAAMSRDGDHADAFRYMAVPVTFANGDGAIVGVTYDRTRASGNPGPLYIGTLLGGAACLLAGVLLGLSALRKPGGSVAE